MRKVVRIREAVGLSPNAYSRVFINGFSADITRMRCLMLANAMANRSNNLGIRSDYSAALQLMGVRLGANQFQALWSAGPGGGLLSVLM